MGALFKIGGYDFVNLKYLRNLKGRTSTTKKIAKKYKKIGDTKSDVFTFVAQANSAFMKILMVCLGNICRSPLAEGILKAKIEKKGLDWQVDSAGTGSWHVGELPDPRSIAIARQYGIDITYQRARQFKADDLQRFDLIFAMDTQNFRDMLRLAKDETERAKIQLIMHMVQPDSNQSVPDPYWDDDGFELVFRMLDEACEEIMLRFEAAL